MSDPPVGDERSNGIGLGVAWLLGLGATLVALHALGHGGLATPPCSSFDGVRAWLQERDTPTAAFAILRVGGLAAAWYLMAVVVLGLSARILRSSRLSRLADLATLPCLRRLMGTAVGLSLSASTSALVALPIVSHGHEPHGRPVVMERVPRPRDDGTATMRVIEQRPTVPPSPPRRPARPATWAVTPGDSFWGIATHVLGDAWHRPPTDAELLPYWRVLIDHNHDRLADPGNPDLIYPGQVFELPSPPARPPPSPPARPPPSP